MPQSKFGLVFIALAIGLVAALFGCVQPSQEIIDEASNSNKEFLLGPEDVLDIVVWKNADLSQNGVVIRPDGKISIPLIGEVKASGRTANQLASQIASRLKEYKDNPVVTVSVKDVNSYYIYVLGEVAKPGKFQLKSHTTVLQAVAIAGGFTVFASKNKMTVIRHVQVEDGQVREIRIPARYNDLIAGTGDIGNFVLKTGDIIVVP